MERTRPKLEVCPAPPTVASSTAAPPQLDAAFRRYAPYVAAIGLRLLGRGDEVDDLVQDVFVQALRGMGALRDADATRGWLATVTVRVAHRRLRARRLWSALGMDVQHSYEDVAAPGASPEQRLLLARVYRALDRLPSDQRIAWALRHVEGETVERVAEVCGCSLATAKRRIKVAHEFVERILSDE